MNTQKTLSTYVNKYQLFPKYGIYDQHAKLRISEFNRYEATIYMIVKTPKVTFIPESFKPQTGYRFLGKLNVNGKDHEVIFNTASIHYENPHVKPHFENFSSFTSFYMNHWALEGNSHASDDIKYAAVSEVDIDRSSKERLVINCAIGHALTKGEGGQIILNPYQLIQHFDMDCLEKLEIIYIGKSTDDTWKRVYNHNKWGFIEEHRTESEDLLVYFMQLDESMIVQGREKGLSLYYRDSSVLSISDITKVTEMALINYFIKEKKFNIEHVGTDITKTGTSRNVLKNNGYKNLVCELSLEGLLGKLGTPSTGYTGDYQVEYEI